MSFAVLIGPVTVSVLVAPVVVMRTVPPTALLVTPVTLKAVPFLNSMLFADVLVALKLPTMLVAPLRLNPWLVVAASVPVVIGWAWEIDWAESGIESAGVPVAPTINPVLDVAMPPSGEDVIVPMLNPLEPPLA